VRVLRALLPVPGVRLYVRRADSWYAAGSELPAFEVPDDLGGQPLAGALLPAQFEWVGPPATEPQQVALRLVADQQPRAATACLCTPAELQGWADTVSAPRLGKVEAACCAGRVLLLGQPLPLFHSGQRFWGERILVPMGLRPDPLLPEQTLAEAAGLMEQEILLWHEAAAEIMPRAAFQPLERSRIRLLQLRHDVHQ
jgi:hypothetical protein